MSRDIKTRLTLEGAAEFKRGMSDAASAIKTLNSEQKLADATFKATGDSQQYLTDKADILRRKIEEQQKAVSAAQAAVAKLNAAGVSQNSREMQTWQTKLNNASAALVTMQAELNSTETELKEQGTAFDEAGDKADEFDGTLKNIGKNITLDAVIKAIDKVRAALETVIRTAAKAGKAMWDMEAGAASWADNVKTEATKNGMTPEEYQRLTYASNFVDVSPETILAARQKLISAIDKANETPKITIEAGVELVDLNEAQEAFAKLGVSIKDSEGNLRSSMDVLKDVIDSLGQIGNETERDIVSNELFGRKFSELKPLIEAGSAAWQHYMDDAPVVSDEALNNLAALDDAIQDAKAQMETTKNEILGQTAPAFTELAGAVASAMGQINDYLKTEEGQAALTALSDALTNLIKSFTDQNLDGAVKAAQDAIGALTSSFEWVAGHGDAVKSAIMGVVGAIVALKAASIGLQAVQLASNLKTLFSAANGTGGGAGSAGGGAAGGGAATGGAATGGQVLRTLKTAGGKVLGAFNAAVTTGMETAVIPVAAAVGSGAIAERTAYNRDFGRFSRAAEATDAVMAIENAGDERIAQMQALLDEFMAMTKDGGGLTNKQAEAIFNAREKTEELTGKSYDALDELQRAIDEAGGNTFTTDYDLQKVLGEMIADLVESLQTAGESAAESAADKAASTAEGVSDRFAEHARQKLDELTAAREELEATSQSAVEEAADSSGSSIDAIFAQYQASLEAEFQRIQAEAEAAIASAYGLQSEASAAADSASASAQSAAAELDKAAGQTPAAGQNAGMGFANGLRNSAGAVVSAANMLANLAAQTINAALKIHSPSRVLFDSGAFTGEGFALGIESEIPRIERASRAMATAATAQPARANTALSAGGTGAAEGVRPIIKNVIMMDGHVLAESLTDYVGENLATEIMTER